MNNQAKTKQIGFIMVVISGMIFGIMPSMVTFCYTKGANKVSMLLMRYIVLSVLLLPKIIKQKNIRELTQKYYLKFFILAFFGMITPLLLFTCYNLLPTGIVTTIHFMYPTVVMIISVTFLHSKFSKSNLVCLCLCISGILLMLDMSNIELNTKGLALTIISSFTWAIYIILLDKYRIDNITSEQVMFFVSIGSVIFLILYGAIAKEFAFPKVAIGWIAMITANIIIAIFGSLFFAIGVRTTDAQTSAIVSTLEPIFSIIMGVILLNEVISIRLIIGSVLILIAVIIQATSTK